MVDMINDMEKKFVLRPQMFENLMDETKTLWYNEYKKQTKLFGLIKLWNLKASGEYSDAFLNDNIVLGSMYRAKKTLWATRMEYEKILACSNDCIQYQKEYEDLDECKICAMSLGEKKARNHRME